jgi:DNA-binding LytR/AlgR family response regulator
MSAALRKVIKMLPSAESAPSSPPDSLAALPVEAQGRTRFVRRRDVVFVEACRDTVKLHTHSGVHIVRRSLSGIAEHWVDAGFIYTHRSYLVAVSAITELRSDSIGGLVAHTELGDVPISRRYARSVRERLFRAAQT